MNYYPFHIGDYASAARHLSWDEDMAYRRLLDAYYTREAPIPLDRRQAYRLACANTTEQREAVDTVLAEFFFEAEDGWRNARCDAEIEAFAQKREKAAQSANARWSNAKAKQSQSEGNANELNDECERIENRCEGNAPNPKTNISTDVDIKGAKRRFDPAAVDLPSCIPFEAWGRWVAYRRERKLKTTEATARAQVANLEAWFHAGHDPAQIISHSIANGWQGLFEPKQQSVSVGQRISHSDQTKLAAARAIFGTEIEGDIHGTSARVIDITPAVAGYLGG